MGTSVDLEQRALRPVRSCEPGAPSVLSWVTTYRRSMTFYQPEICILLRVDEASGCVPSHRCCPRLVANRIDEKPWTEFSAACARRKRLHRRRLLLLQHLSRRRMA